MSWWAARSFAVIVDVGGAAAAGSAVGLALSVWCFAATLCGSPLDGERLVRLLVLLLGLLRKPRLMPAFFTFGDVDFGAACSAALLPLPAQQSHATSAVVAQTTTALVERPSGSIDC